MHTCHQDSGCLRGCAWTSNAVRTVLVYKWEPNDMVLHCRLIWMLCGSCPGVASPMNCGLCAGSCCWATSLQTSEPPHVICLLVFVGVHVGGGFSLVYAYDRRDHATRAVMNRVMLVKHGGMTRLSLPDLSGLPHTNSDAAAAGTACQCSLELLFGLQEPPAAGAGPQAPGVPGHGARSLRH